MHSSHSQTSTPILVVWLGFMLLMVMLTANCAHKVPNVPICAELSPVSGTCVMSVTADTFDVDEDHKWPLDDQWRGKDWWSFRHQMLQVPAEISFVPLRSFIIKICKDTKCEGEISNWQRSLEGVTTIAPKPLLP